MEDLLAVADKAGLVVLARGPLRRLLPHSGLICGFGAIRPKGGVRCRLLAVDFPVAYLDAIRQDDGSIASPLMDAWLETGSPVFFDGNAPPRGIHDVDGDSTSYFNLCGVGERGTVIHLLRLLVPGLHQALARMMCGRPVIGAAAPGFTQRELDILSWLYPRTAPPAWRRSIPSMST